MSKVRVSALGISLDGFAAGPHQDSNNPIGLRGMELMQWFVTTASFKHRHGQPGGTLGVDNDFGERSFSEVGAWIIGRNMFGPIRGDWGDESWRGWWGDNPPYHVPVFVLTHHARAPLQMEGGTTFHFVTEGPEAALRLARQAAKEKDVRIGGGVSTIRQFLVLGVIDELHLALSSVLMGEGENLFAGLNLDALGYQSAKVIPGEQATHILLAKK
jgi:dihydrofolate reductase